MTLNSNSTDRLLTIYLALGQYPVLSGRIRARMRQALFERGIIQPHAFEARVRDMAVRSQEREGIRDPYGEEASEIWDMRIQRVRDQLTDLIFSHQMSFEEFERITNNVLSERGLNQQEQLLSVNPELAPQEIVFEQAMMFERLNPEDRPQYEARMQEAKVVLIRNLISDQLQYINVAKEWFTLSDLLEIRRRKIGAGKIGGKAAGMLLAHRVLADSPDFKLRTCMKPPESFYIGSNEIYTFMTINNLVHWNDQKYKTEEEMRAEFPMIVRDFQSGEFPPDILDRLQSLLIKMGKKPMIVRSSSQLEDNFGTSFAGKYDSVFLPNQGTLEQNLGDLTRAVASIYASTMNPNALLYRRARGLQDYDERMAVLIQEVQGEQYGRYYLPHGAGVAFSRNTYRWAPQIRAEDGFVRLVWGMGTRAVDRVGNDYPRVIALSHPLLRPTTNPKLIRQYSQNYVDVIDLEENSFRTMHIHEVLDSNYKPLRYIAQTDQGGFFQAIRSRVLEGGVKSLVVTFDEFLKRTNFAETMREMLKTLELAYRLPVDVEFTLSIKEETLGKPQICLTLVQCRPQAQLMNTAQVIIPKKLPQNDIIFDTHFVVPHGQVDNIYYVIYVPHESYFALPTANDRTNLARALGKLNTILEGETFFCMGPGRWGSSNSDLGVPIAYGDIYNARALVELAGENVGLPPEPSLGTHFFQDLMESQIYPLAIPLDEPENHINQDFFYKTPNCVTEFMDLDPLLQSSLHLIRVSDFRHNHHIRLLMNDDDSRAVAYLMPDTF
ncbi:MAG: hypothetical protein CVU39_24920 [Chloroflexi bacterium HGW-Chloroflexi-10]|nr:MAG: hypothetical protein CVU39_24920 [Chloroflexi bacterium HGW-Chloroflexi-10]